MNVTSKRLFGMWQIVVLSVAFVGSAVLIQRSLRYVCEHLIAFNCPYYWPMNVFSPRIPTLRDIAVAVSVTIAFFLLFKFLEMRRFSVGLSIAVGILLIAGLTSIHGLDVGFYEPIAGDAQNGLAVPFSADGQEYYHDALKITDPVDFLKRYNEIQPTLHRHAHTHPPGAVLTLYFLTKLLQDPALIAVFIMMVATATTVFFVYRLLLTEIGDQTAGYVAFLFVLLPAVQIYYLATLDALITAILTGAIYLFCFGKARSSVVGAAIMLTLSFLLTFVSLFILPVMVGFDLIVRRSLKRSVIVIGSMVAVHLLLYWFVGYNGFQSFRTASQFENPHGFMLFVDPWDYFFTRIEDVAEIIFFFGPFLLVLFIRGTRSFQLSFDFLLRPLNVLTVMACATLMAMYLAGAFRTGETARACAFIYPYLLFPVARYLESTGTGAGERRKLAALVFLQALGMQTLGNYFW